MPEKTGAGGFSCTAFAILLGACLAVAASLTVPALAQNIDSTPPEARAIALPALLGDSDRARYEQIFALQENGDLAAAAKIIATLDDGILMGHVLAQKYLHPTAHRSKFSELKPWLAEYGDHPDARRLFRLAMKRKPAGAKAPKRPTATAAATPRLTGGESEYVAPRISGRGINRSQRKRLSGMQRDMRHRIRRGWPTGARKILTSKAHLGLASEAQFDTYQARIAWSYYLHNKDTLAFELAAASAERSRRFVADADWTAGLAAWRLGRLEAAAQHFARLAESASASPWLRSSGAYWAARSELRLRRPQYVSYWLERAASEARTFYGLLATRALGREP
ncbi:MAG: lytic transglycosylase domain-containing protein, partial [Alphaproteobacteria bacterium]|nr:lytic transglycosylase domain-containing protein [Alphaproteobacteria bacterium]